jgi:hypothetical protein
MRPKKRPVGPNSIDLDRNQRGRMALPFTPHVPLSNPLTADDNGSYATYRRGRWPTPRLDPQVEYIMKIDVRQKPINRNNRCVISSHTIAIMGNHQ